VRDQLGGCITLLFLHATSVRLSSASARSTV
jgi:hypothetical protein